MRRTIIIVISTIVVGLLIALVTGIIVYNKTFIGMKEAKRIALVHADLKESEVKRLEVEFEDEDRNYEYKVEFIYDNKEYEYTIDAYTGEVILFEIDY